MADMQRIVDDIDRWYMRDIEDVITAIRDRPKAIPFNQNRNDSFDSTMESWYDELATPEKKSKTRSPSPINIMSSPGCSTRSPSPIEWFVDNLNEQETYSDEEDDEEYREWLARGSLLQYIARPWKSGHPAIEPLRQQKGTIKHVSGGDGEQGGVHQGSNGDGGGNSGNEEAKDGDNVGLTPETGSSSAATGSPSDEASSREEDQPPQQEIRGSGERESETSGEQEESGEPSSRQDSDNSEESNLPETPEAEKRPHAPPQYLDDDDDATNMPPLLNMPNASTDFGTPPNISSDFGMPTLAGLLNQPDPEPARMGPFAEAFPRPAVVEDPQSESSSENSSSEENSREGRNLSSGDRTPPSSAEDKEEDEDVEDGEQKDADEKTPTQSRKRRGDDDDSDATKDKRISL